MNREILRRLWILVRRRPDVALALGGLLAFVVWSVLPSQEGPKPRQPASTSGTGPNAPRLLSPDVQLQGELSRIFGDVPRVPPRTAEPMLPPQVRPLESTAPPAPPRLTHFKIVEGPLPP